MESFSGYRPVMTNRTQWLAFRNARAKMKCFQRLMHWSLLVGGSHASPKPSPTNELVTHQKNA